MDFYLKRKVSSTAGYLKITTDLTRERNRGESENITMYRLGSRWKCMSNQTTKIPNNHANTKEEKQVLWS